MNKEIVDLGLCLGCVCRASCLCRIVIDCQGGADARFKDRWSDEENESNDK